MRKIWIIARREYLHNLRKRSFLFTAFGMPIFFVGLMLLNVVISKNQVTAVGGLGEIAYVDEVGVIADGYAMPEEYIAYESEEAAREAFEAETVGAYLVIPESYWEDGLVSMYASKEVPEGIRSQIWNILHDNVADIAPARYADRLHAPLNMVARMVGGEMLEVTQESIIALILLPIVFGMVFMMAIITTSQFLMRGVVSEKETRIMEILVTSSTPEQMLWGRVLGLGALGMTQIFVWVLAGGAALAASGSDSPFAQVLHLPPIFGVIVLIYFVLGYLLNGSIMAGLGASVTSEQEGRMISGLFSMITVLPMMFAFTFIENPNGTVPVFLSMFPLTAPVAMLMRIPLASIPMWQLGLSFALLIVMMLIVVWVSARVFRLGMLMYGKRLGLRDIMTVLRTGMGKAPMTSAPGAKGKR